MTASPTDPRIDQALQKQLDDLRRNDPYGGDDGRSRWKNDGSRDRWIIAFACAVRRAAPKFGLPPSPTDAFVTAHAAISTGWGRSKLMRVADNPFGIKASNVKSWPGPIIYSGAIEYKNGIPYSTTAVWRVYKSMDAGVVDHLSLVTNPRLRYRLAGEKLRSGELDYMAQLGRDGWYTDLPERINARWLGAKGYVEQVLATAQPSCRVVHPAVWGLLGAALAGGSYWAWRRYHAS